MRILPLFLFVVIASLCWIPGAGAVSFNNPLVNAVDMGDQQHALDLLKQGTPPDAKGDFGVTPLMRAAFRGNTKLAQILLDSGAFVNAADVGGDTPLHLAARNGHAEMVKMLLDYDAFIDIPDKEKWTPLMRAVMAKQTDVVKLLINEGASLDTKTDTGETVLVHAAMVGKPEIMALITGSKRAEQIPQDQFAAAGVVADRAGHKKTERILASATPADTSQQFADNRASDADAHFQSRYGQSAPTEETDRVMPTPIADEFARNEDTSSPSPWLNTAKAPERLPVFDDQLTKKLADTGSDDEQFWGLPEPKGVTLNETKPKKAIAKVQSTPQYAPSAKVLADIGDMKVSTAKTPSGAPRGGEVTYAMQLGAFNNPDQALFIWENLHRKNSDILGNAQPNILTATELNHGKDFYRLRTGQYAEKKAADAACSGLRGRNIECFVVKNVEPQDNQPPRLALYIGDKNETPESAIANTPDAQEPENNQMASLDRPAYLPPDALNDASAPIDLNASPSQPSTPLERPFSFYPVPAPGTDEAPQVADATEPTNISTPEPAEENPAYAAAAPAAQPNTIFAPATVATAAPAAEDELPWKHDPRYVQRQLWLLPTPPTDVPPSPTTFATATPVAPEMSTPDAPIAVADSTALRTQYQQTEYTPPIGTPEQYNSMFQQYAQQPSAAAPVDEPIPAYQQVAQAAPAAQPSSDSQPRDDEDISDGTEEIDDQPYAGRPTYIPRSKRNAIPLPDRNPATIAMENQQVPVLPRSAYYPPVAQVPTPAPAPNFGRSYPPLDNQATSPHTNISEAVLVPDDKFNAGYSGQSLRRQEGYWLQIGPFANRPMASDYGVRMFKYDENLSYLQTNLVDTPSPYGTQVALHVGPVNTSDEAYGLCETVRAGGVQCNVSGAGSSAAPSPATQNRNTAPAQAAPPPAQTASSAEQHWINLGTFSDAPQAEYYWMYLQEDNEDILGSLKYDTAKTKHGEFSNDAVQLRVGPFDAHSRASQICNIMRYRNISCLVMQ